MSLYKKNIRKEYRKSEWKEYQKNVIELDGYKCTKCKRGSDEVTLQVHHKKYISGRKPWEYATSDCETLCKGCHAAEHGITMPKIDWDYITNEDLGDLVGTCENCGASIRYVFTIQHKSWGVLEVGTMCCDKLTDTNIASNKMESAKSYDGRKERFLKSKRWKLENNTWKIKQGSFDIEIILKDTTFYMKIHNQQSNKKYETLEDAKSKAFDVIETGELIKYMEKYKISFTKK